MKDLKEGDVVGPVSFVNLVHFFKGAEMRALGYKALNDGDDNEAAHLFIESGQHDNVAWQSLREALDLDFSKYRFGLRVDAEDNAVITIREVL